MNVFAEIEWFHPNPDLEVDSMILTVEATVIKGTPSRSCRTMNNPMDFEYGIDDEIVDLTVYDEDGDVVPTQQMMGNGAVEWKTMTIQQAAEEAVFATMN